MDYFYTKKTKKNFSIIEFDSNSEQEHYFLMLEYMCPAAGLSVQEHIVNIERLRQWCKSYDIGELIDVDCDGKTEKFWSIDREIEYYDDALELVLRYLNITKTWLGLTPEDKVISKQKMNTRDFYITEHQSLDLNGYPFELPEIQVLIGDLFLKGYDYKLPESFIGVTGELGLQGYGFPLPSNFKHCKTVDIDYTYSIPSFTKLTA